MDTIEVIVKYTKDKILRNKRFKSKLRQLSSCHGEEKVCMYSICVMDVNTATNTMKTNSRCVSYVNQSYFHDCITFSPFQIFFLFLYIIFEDMIGEIRIKVVTFLQFLILLYTIIYILIIYK